MMSRAGSEAARTQHARELVADPLLEGREIGPEQFGTPGPVLVTLRQSEAAQGTHDLDQKSARRVSEALDKNRYWGPGPFQFSNS
jgi:hypothetical protein